MKYCLSRARRIIENSFGILISRFCIFQKLIATYIHYVGTVDKIELAACALANWLRKEKQNTYITYCDIDWEDNEARNITLGSSRIENTGLENICWQGCDHPPISAVQKRKITKNYFINEGVESWQDKMIH